MGAELQWRNAGHGRPSEIKFDDERVGCGQLVQSRALFDGIRWDRKADDPTKGNTTVALTWDELQQTRRIMAYHRAMVGERHRLSFLIFDQDRTPNRPP